MGNLFQPLSQGQRSSAGLRLLYVAQGVQYRVALGAINRTVPIVRARLRRDVDYRTGVATVLRAEVVGRDLILINEFCITEENPGPSDRVVVVVLSVNLLVIVAPTQPVDRETSTPVGVREKVITGGRNARQQHC